MIVVQTDVIAQMTFTTEKTGVVSELYDRYPLWEAPYSWRSQYLRLLALYFQQGLIDHEESIEALDIAGRIIGTREHLVSPQATLNYTKRSTCTPEDCEFVVLAETLQTKLITFNKKLIREFPAIAMLPEEYLKR